MSRQPDQSGDRLELARSVAAQSADLMARLQRGEITPRQARRELDANPAVDSFRIG